MSTPAVSEEAHVALDGVIRQYDGPPAVHALGPIDVAIRRGEFFSVVGPSGCGKSTLLDVLCGLARPSSGSVQFEGK
jgi:NitT/TauT family transport system ATP-binding protein